jgi:prepilin-type N-terminal cleavage/methylation domain-containing protein
MLKEFRTQGPHRARPRGYTLIELLIVVAVLGLAGAMLVPMLGDRGDFDTQGAVRRLAADMMFAQSDALANQEHRRLVFIEDPDAEGQFLGWCVIKVRESELGAEFDADTARYVNDPLAPAGEDGRFIVNLRTDGRFGDTVVASVELDGGASFITYDELGGTVTSTGQPGSGGEIVLRGGTSVYRVTIDGVTGKISIADITNEAPELEVGAFGTVGG